MSEYISSVSSTSVFDISSLMPSAPAPMLVSDPSGDVPFSIDDLINSQQAIIGKENDDRTISLAFANTSIDSLKPAMYNWAAANFPASYMVSSLSLAPPAVCSDGVTRQLVQYYEWLINMTITEWLDTMNAKVSGMYFSFSHDGNYAINLHLSR